MRIIHFIPDMDYSSGGTTTFLKLLAGELGKKTNFYIITKKSNNPVEVDNAQIIYMPSGLRFYWQMAKSWKKILNTIRPDIVHINGCWQPECALFQFWAQKQGYKVVLSPHGMLEPWIMKRNYWTKKLVALILYQRRAIREANYLHATVEREKNNLLNLKLNEKIAVIPCGIEVNKIKIKESWELKRQIVYLSRIHPKKGIEFLIEAVTLLKDKMRGYSIFIAGEGEPDYVNSLKERIATNRVDHLFNFLGGVYGEDKWKLLRSADLFVLPTYSENFGIAIAEALACGTPVLTTTGTPWEKLETEHCGWYVEIGSEPTAKAIDGFLELSAGELNVMGRNGRQLIEKEYNSIEMALSMCSLYNRLIATGQNSV